MSDVLSQSEIDALLSAVSSGDVPVQEEGIPLAEKKADASTVPGSGQGQNESPDWIAYDLASQEKFVRGKLGALEGIHERFARLFRMTLSGLLKKTISVTYTSTDYLRFSEYLTTILLPCSLNVYQMEEPRGSIIFTVGTKLTYALVDSYYGGSERPFSKVGGREEFTAIENQIIQKVTHLAARDIQDAWKLNYPMQLDFIRSESNPHFIGSIHGSETVAVVNFDVEMENLSGPFTVILQLRALDSIQQYLNANVMGEIPVDKELWKQHWLRELGAMKLEARVNLGEMEESLRGINNFKKGEELMLTQDAAGALSVQVEGIPKFRGVMGVCRGSAALRITEVLPIQNKE